MSMKKFILGALVCVVLVGLSACSKDNVQQQSPNITQPQSPTTYTPATEPIVAGTSSSCDIAPKQLTLAGKTYLLSNNAKAEEGPMKLAYIKCEKGTFTMGDADNGYVIFSTGKTNDIYLAGGRTEKGLHQFYSLEEAAQSPGSNKANVTPTPLSTTSKVAASDSMQLIGTYSNQSEQVSLYNSTDGIVVKSSSDKGKTWSYAVPLPFKQDWEKQIQAGNVYTSLLSSSSPSWILLTSDPALGLMNKSLYESSDNGKTWIFINDVSQVIDGYVTGISFRSPTDGWISATYHQDTAMVPLYRTKDGGKTWLLQNIPIPKGYKYGNAYAPVFNINNAQSGTLKIEFVSDTSKDEFEFITKDGGETWVKK
ncbi:WD40/YVTN/BNR-like repeat-containing protein [Paenibacillus whitsoniae]|uniref:Exo-alpha-sialidase n=1 Tax=Paenibacillus whitsoniae TaxID=2496558 RepID=A0A3S0BJ41_9BACL|nr:sialidase family protein [Paenibacillus whitsoniae]RTE07191.1 exo-alpha-sialidase [Paenibacillus whitsoniae]